MMAKKLDFPDIKLALLPLMTSLADQSQRNTSSTSFSCCFKDLLATMVSYYRWMKMKGSPANIRSIIRWKVLPAFPQKFEEAKRGDDGSLRYVIWMHKNLKISFS
jgi:hypothetical protein